MMHPDEGERRVVVVTLVFVAVGYVALATLAAITLPWRGLADAGSHLNYVEHVHEGMLLEPYGRGFEEFRPPGAGDEPRRQYASAHPPGYYAAMALLAGGDLEDGRWERAVIKIRAANIVLGLVGLAALAGFGWTAGGRWRARLAIALPAVGTATFGYLRYSAEVYNDLAVTTVALVSLTVGARALIRGPSPISSVALAVLCGIGMGMKATFIVTAGTVCLMVLAGAVLHGSPNSRRWLRGAASAVGIGVAALASFAWFYERNRRLSGSWHRSTPKIPVGDRPRRDLGDVITDARFHLIAVERLVGRGAPRFASTSRWISLSIAVPALASSIAHVIRRIPPRTWSRTTTVLVTLLVLHLVGHQVLQLSHAVGYGGLNWRYFLPATITIAAGLGLGAASLGRASAFALPALVGALATANVVSMATYGRSASALESLGVLGALRDGAVANDLPAWLPMVLLSIAIAAMVGVASQIWTHSQFFGDPSTRSEPGLAS